MKLRLLTAIALCIVGVVSILPQQSHAATDCTLEPLQAYKTASSGAIYYVTNKCQKRLFTKPDLFYSYFESFNIVRTVSQSELDTLPFARNMYMEWGAKYNPGDGGLVKSIDGARVYLFVNDTLYPIDKAETFLAFGFTWDMIATVSPELIASYIMGETIAGEDGLPEFVLVKYENSPDVYRFIRNANGKIVLRHVPSMNVLRQLAFRSDRIITISGSYVIDSIPVTPPTDPEVPPVVDPTPNPTPTPTPPPPTSGVTCDATGSGVCLYVSPVAQAGTGSYTSPYRTFYEALTDARLVPGSVIYALSGTFTADHAMVIGRNPYFSGDRIAMIGLMDMDGYLVNTPAYSVPNGTTNNPITITAYPGATPIIDMRGAFNSADRNAISHSAVYIERKSNWIIEGLTLYGGMVNLAGGWDGVYTHDITIRNNTVADVEIEGGDNPGLIRIDRTYGGDGIYNVLIENNTLHSIYDIGATPETTADFQHFGAVTILSRQEYEGFGVGTRDITIRNNTMYNLPQVFYLKNPMAGPIRIEDNDIRDARYLGVMDASNISMTGNLVVDVARGWWRVGRGGFADSRTNAINGHNATITGNTFVGLDSLMEIWSGSDHVISDNIFYGMSGSAIGANYNTPAYLYQAEYAADSASTVSSRLHTIDSNNNCFFLPSANAQFAARYLPASITGNGLQVEHYTVGQAQQTFGFDLDSTFVYGMSRSNVFTSAYALRDASLCTATAVVPPVVPTPAPTPTPEPTPEPTPTPDPVVPEQPTTPTPVSGTTYTVTNDSADARTQTGNWSSATAGSNHFSTMSLYAVAGDVIDTYRFETPDALTAGVYQVYAWNSCYTPRNTSVLHRIVHAGGTSNIRLNQDSITGTCNRWDSLGVYEFDGDGTEWVDISDEGTTAASGTYIGADAVRFVAI